MSNRCGRRRWTLKWSLPAESRVIHCCSQYYWTTGCQCYLAGPICISGLNTDERVAKKLTTDKLRDGHFRTTKAVCHRCPNLFIRGHYVTDMIRINWWNNCRSVNRQSGLSSACHKYTLWARLLSHRLGKRWCRNKHKIKWSSCKVRDMQNHKQSV